MRMTIAHIFTGIFIWPTKGDGQKRFLLGSLAFHINTIEKSMKQIVELSAKESPDMNQIVRWVQNKEHHSDKIREVVTQYFMTQRVNPVDAKDPAGHDAYVKKLTLLHEMLVYAMKCKQTTDLANVEQLKKLVDAFSKAYFGPQ